MAHEDYYTEYIRTHDDIFGLDTVTINIGDFSLSGYFKHSPLENRMIIQFQLNPDEKPYRGCWMTSENDLYILYINGIFKNRRLNTLDILPEHPNDVPLYHYKLYSGDLIVINQQYIVNPYFEKYKITENEYQFKFKEGILITK